MARYKVGNGFLQGLLVSLVASCGLVQVNGKPLGGSSSSQSSPSESSAASESSSSSAPSSSSESTSSSEGAPSPAAQPASASIKPASRPAAEDAGGTRSLDDFKKVPKTRAAWSPLQQYSAIRDSSGYKGYAAMIIADELGDRLSQAGRLALIEKCLPGERGGDGYGSGALKKDATSASRWAACGADVEAFDLKALAREVQREGLTAEERKRFFDAADKTMIWARAIGTSVLAAAKEDPGVAQIVAMSKTARDEWRAYASGHAEQLADLAKLQDLVRENKNGLAGDCLERTRPAIEKIVRATKWRENDTPMDPNEFYVNAMPTTTAAFIATMAWGACAALTHRSGATIYQSATASWYGWSTYEFNRYYRRGPRTLTVAKLYQEPFKPKFVDRSLNMGQDSIRDPHEHIRGEVEGSQTEHVGVIAKLVKSGDETTIRFASQKVMRCSDWRDTNRIQHVSPNGDVLYEKKCMRREPVEIELSDVVAATVFTAGLAAGVTVTEELGFPVVAQRGNKFVAALGIKL